MISNIVAYVIKEPKTEYKMRFSKALLIFTFILVCLPIKVSYIFGQTQIDNTKDINATIALLLEDFIENSDGNASFDFNTIEEDIRYYLDHKININSASFNELKELIFLSDTEIQGILNYRSIYGNLLSPYEVQAIPALSRNKSRLLIAFIYVDNDRVPALPLTMHSLSKAKDEFYLKLRRPVENRRGFESINSKPPVYRGNPSNWYMRYAHSDNNLRKWGLILEKDSGEQWISPNSITGVDYVSAYFEQKNLTPLVTQINIGDYSVNLGQGLISHNAFGIGKSSFTTLVMKGGYKVRHYSSVVENQALRGLAIQLRPAKSIKMIGFASYDKRDANLLKSDTIDYPQAVSSLQSSGLHRTINEIEDQDAIGELTYGGHIGWSNKKFSLGLNNMNHFLDKALVRAVAPYRFYQWEGQYLSNFSLDYQGFVRGWTLFGEVAYSSNGGWAQVHGILKSLDRNLDMAVVYRNYQPQYQAMYPNAFGEGLLANNESGIYFGIEYRPSSTISIRAYADYWQNPWLRSRVDGTGQGQEYLLRMEYKPSKRQLYYLNYRYERKLENSSLNNDIDIPVFKTTQRIRLHTERKIHKNIRLRSRVEFSHYVKEEENAYGMLAYQDLIHTTMDRPLSMSMRLAYFNITDFDARIYAYENDLLNEYYIPAFSGEGLRYYLKAKYKINPRLMIEARIDQTRYLDRDLISSGNNAIEGNTISTIKTQLRWRL